MSLLQKRDLKEQEFFDAAVRVLQFDTALQEGWTPDAVGFDEACASRILDEELKERVRSLFDTHAELRYAGVSNGGRPVNPGSEPWRERLLPGRGRATWNQKCGPKRVHMPRRYPPAGEKNWGR